MSSIRCADTVHVEKSREMRAIDRNVGVFSPHQKKYNERISRNPRNDANYPMYEQVELPR